MYGYYALVSIPAFKFVMRFGYLITFLQLAQMVLGLYLTVHVTLFCPLSWTRNWHGDLFALGMYGVYFYLFLQLVVEKLTQRGRSSKAPRIKHNKEE